MKEHKSAGRLRHDKLRAFITKRAAAAAAEAFPGVHEDMAPFEVAYETVTSERPVLDWIISGQLLELIKAIIEVWKLLPKTTAQRT